VLKTAGRAIFSMKELYHGFYATRVYLPLSSLSRRWRRFSRRVRGKSDRFLQSTRLPEVSWRRFSHTGLPRVWEHRKENGNVRPSELGILAALATDCADGTNLFEIGTFDGRTTLNLVLNAPTRCQVYTLDLPPELATKFAIAEGERHMVEKPKPGARYEQHRAAQPDAIGRIHQLLGDSATFDYSPYHGSCSLVFVDGSHAYDYAMSDTRAAMQLVRPGGVIIWHDYGIWEGVTKALEELEQRDHLGLKNIRGTSLVYWRKP
jgi:predicted O-methyltransferase YrrM